MQTLSACFLLILKVKGGQFVQIAPKLFEQAVFLFGWVVFMNREFLGTSQSHWGTSLGHPLKLGGENNLIINSLGRMPLSSAGGQKVVHVTCALLGGWGHFFWLGKVQAR